jgi:hypothetical protein
MSSREDHGPRRGTLSIPRRADPWRSQLLPTGLCWLRLGVPVQRTPKGSKDVPAETKVSDTVGRRATVLGISGEGPSIVRS